MHACPFGHCALHCTALVSVVWYKEGGRMWCVAANGATNALLKCYTPALPALLFLAIDFGTREKPGLGCMD